MKKGMMGVTGLFLLPVLVVVALWVFRNPIVTSVFQIGGEALTGAEVSVEGLKAGPFSLDLAWEKLAVADARDPWKNLVETGPGRLRFAWAPLLKGCFVAESLTAEEVVLAGDRLVKARVMAPVAHEKANGPLSLWLEKRLEVEAKSIPVLQVEDGGSRDMVFLLLRDAGLETPDRVEQARAAIRARVADRRERLRRLDFERRVRSVGESLDTLDYKKAESPEELVEIITAARALAAELERIRTEIRKERRATAADVVRFRKWKGAFENWVEEDTRRMNSMLHLDSQGLNDVAATLFSHRLGALLVPVLRRLETLSALGYGIEEGRGQEGMADRPLPRFWVKKALVGVVSGSLQLHGSVTGFSSDQSRSAEPLRFLLEGTSSREEGRYGISGKVDCMEGPCRQQVEIHAEEVPQADVVLAPGVRLKGGEAEFQMDYNADEAFARAETRVTVTGLRVAGNGDGLLWFQDALARVLTRVPSLEVRSDMTYASGEGHWAMASNLDAHLKVEFDATVGRETARLRQGLESEVERRLRRHGDLLDEELAMAEAGMMAPLDKLENDVRREAQGFRDFAAAVKREHREMKQAIEEKGIDALMKLKL